MNYQNLCKSTVRQMAILNLPVKWVYDILSFWFEFQRKHEFFFPLVDPTSYLHFNTVILSNQRKDTIEVWSNSKHFIDI